MSETIDVIKCRPRVARSKGDARQLRREGWVPGVAYGPSREPMHLSVDPKTFVTARRTYGRAHVYNVEIEGNTGFRAVIKEVQQDPTSRKLLHVDLYAVDESRPMRAQVRIQLEGKARGVVEGGRLVQNTRLIKLRGLPGQIPDAVVVDVTDLGRGESYHLSDLKLPEGVEYIARQNDVVVQIESKGGKETADEGGGEG